MRVLPYPIHYRRAFAFSRLLYLLGIVSSSRLTYSLREPMRLTVLKFVDNNQRGLYLCPGENGGTKRMTDQYHAPTHLPFGYGVSALLRRSSDYETDGNSLALVLLALLWVVCPLRLCAFNLAYPACIGFIAYYRYGWSH